MAMQARIGVIEGDAGKIINERIFPRSGALQGFTAVNFLADRSAEKLVAAAFYGDEAALAGSVEAVSPMRTEVAEAMGGKAVSVEPYERVARNW